MVITNNNMDYTNIENPYNQFVDRTIQSEVPISPDVEVREGGSVNDLWVTAFIRSVNWKPRSVGFNIDGTTGDAEFNTLYSHNFKMLPTGGTNGTFSVLRASGDNTFTINSSDYPFVEIHPDPNNGIGPAISVVYPLITSGLVENQPLLNIENQLSAVGSIGVNVWLDANSAAHSAYGMKMKIDASVGTPYAFWFNGSEKVNAAVGGAQDYKIRIKIGSTTYYIPCYTA